MSEPDNSLDYDALNKPITRWDLFVLLHEFRMISLSLHNAISDLAKGDKAGCARELADVIRFDERLENMFDRALQSTDEIKR